MKIEPKITGDIDPVNKPMHYNQAGIECIDAIEAMTENMSGYLAPQAANVLKYMWRCEYKNGLEDIERLFGILNVCVSAGWRSTSEKVLRILLSYSRRRQHYLVLVF